MELPAPTSIDGAYWYLISIIVLIATVSGLYLAAAMVGLAPDPSDLIDATPPTVVAATAQLPIA